MRTSRARASPILVTTHYLDEAEHCHRIAIINAGKLAAIGTSHELKQIFADRPIVEIHSSRPVDVMKALDQMERDPEDHGVRHRRARRAEAGTDRSRRRCAAVLTRAGLEIRAVDRVMPSLEDVFLDVVERAS